MSNAGYYTRKTKTAPRVHRDIERPDWTAVIHGLIKAGYPKNQIALAANCTREMVYSMLRGNTPPWDVGAAVLRLAANSTEPEPCAPSQ